MKPPLAILLAATVLVALAVWWLSREPALPLPDALTQAQIEALSEAALVQAVTTDLRTRLQAAGATSGRWRAWPEPARHVLAWSWVEGDAGPGSTPPFPGFAILRANPERNLPGCADIAAAYQALGATAVAAAVRAAEQAGDDAALDRRLGQALGRGTVPAMRAYIRAHTAELAAAR